VAKGGLHPFESPPSDLPPGNYRLSFVDASGQAICQFELNYDGNPPASAPFTSKVEDAFASVDYDHEARLELDRQKTSTYYRATIDHYMDQLTVLGGRMKAEVKIKELQQEVYEKLIENNLRMLEAINSRISKIQTPPEPPHWDKIVGAAAPAFAALGIEIVRALKGVQAPGASQPLLPSSDERTTRMYEIVGNITSSERLNELIQDKEKFATWMESVRNFAKDDPRAKTEKSSETEKVKSE
jgi:hypothetical protein